MAITTVYPSPAQPKTEYVYSPAWTTWQGFVDVIPELKSILGKIADTTTASWDTYGPHARSAREWLNNITGYGKQTFKMQQNVGVKVGLTCGDEVYLIQEKDRNLLMLDPNNLIFKIENGSIVKYKEKTGNQKGYEPKQILHIPNAPDWTRPYGRSAVEYCKNLL